jgi:hypothetical protein
MLRPVLHVNLSEDVAMPTLSSFYGIKIYMYWGDHAPPHFHATAEGIWVVIAIRTLETLEGGLSPRHMELVLQWAGMHQTEIMEAWELCSTHKHPAKITPLP